jgi:diguanylate cyclase (GGDEF)-like protein
MRLNMAHAILQSRVGSKLFAIVFVLIAVPLGVVSLLAYQLGDYMLRESAADSSRDLAKAVGRHLLDRLRTAEGLLLIHTQEPRSSHGSVIGLDERLAQFFTHIETQHAPKGADGSASVSSLRVLEGQGDDGFPVVELTGISGPNMVRARFASDYLWENAQSGTHRVCVSGEEFARPVCQGVEEQGPQSIRVEREILFKPYFQAANWTVTASQQPDIRQFLPFSLAALIGNVSAIAFLLAIICSSVMLRRVTRPLDALTLGTRAVLKGDFSQRVVIEDRSNEFKDLADSFNAMTEEVGRDLNLFRLLAQMDQAIIEQRSFGEVAGLMLAHLRDRSVVGHACVVQWPHSEARPTALALGPDGSLQQSQVQAPREVQASVSETSGALKCIEPVEFHDLLIANTQTQRVWLRLERPPAPDESAGREIAAFRQRLAVALHAQEHEQELQRRSVQDSLTGLLNRFGLVETINRLVRQHTHPAGDTDVVTRGFAVVYMDLDGFKEINDAYGHDAGDRALEEVARRMRACIGGHALAMARPGGDEFVFILQRDASANLQADAASIMHALKAPFFVARHTVAVTASLGLALFPEHGATHDDLLKHADTAMYTAKAAGRNRFVEFEYSLAAQLADRLSMRDDLRQALKREQMFVVYQPRVDVRNHQMGSVEALLRWRHPEKGLISPDVFIPLAEECGFIPELGHWVLRRALTQFMRWQADATVPIRSISVN